MSGSANISGSESMRTMSLKLRLGIGAALLGLGTLAIAAILWFGLTSVAERLDTALASERRMARYATLSTQAATFLVVATESVQTGLDADIRLERLDPVIGQMRRTFVGLHADVEEAVAQAAGLGLDAQSRLGTQSLGIARMQAMLDNTLRGLAQPTDDRVRLRAHIDSFASNFDPLLNQAVNSEVRFRTEILAGIADLRRTLSVTALTIALVTTLAVAAFYFGLIRPQFRRLARLRKAAHRIAQEDFAIALPVTREDEIGRLYAETNRMAAALQARKDAVRQEWARLNETIAARTEELRAANTRLAEADENRRRFFADISHELRTPLTVILMEAEIGRRAGGPQGEAFAVIEARAARLNRRIDDLLRVARSDSGELSLDRQPVALAGIIEKVRAEIQPEVDNAGMTLTIPPVPEATLDCDPNWIRQVILSLVRNAIRHARSGRAVQIDTARGDAVRISVTDNGPGIAPGDQARVFERFAQGGSANAQGFGVGLALARWVVESHGGSIRLQSPLPRDAALGDAPGTRITLVLPAAAE